MATSSRASSLGPCEVPVGHPALDVLKVVSQVVSLCTNIVCTNIAKDDPALSLSLSISLYLFLVDVQGFVDREWLVGPEDLAPPSVTTMASGEP
jgi:hypothetical protein